MKKQTVLVLVAAGLALTLIWGVNQITSTVNNDIPDGPSDWWADFKSWF